MHRFAFAPRSGADRSGFVHVLLLLVLFGVAAPAGAQDAPSSGPDAVPVAAFAQAAVLSTPAPQLLPAVAPAPTRRPKPLIPLYVSFASLQAMDVHSTSRALGRGAVEANPLMKGVAGNTLTLTAVKMAGSAGVIYAAEKMWKKNRKAAVIFMLAANAGMAWVVQHNYRAVK